MKADTFLKQFEQLAEAPDGITKLRELILQLAVRGKLVEQDPNDEPISVGEPAEDGLPESWRVPALGDVLEVQNGYAFKSRNFNEVGEGLPLIRIRDIMNEETEVHCSEEYREDFLVQHGEILIGMDGNFNVSRWKGSTALLNQRVCKLKDFAGEVLSDYVLVGIQEQLDRVREKSKNYTTVLHLSAKQVRSIRLPFAPLAEQKRIVAKVDELMALCDDLEAKQQAKRTKKIALNRASLHAVTEPNGSSLATAWHRVRNHFDHLYTIPETVAELRQTILQLAVMGRLVPQDPSDLPASELLKKIQAEKQRLIAEGAIRKPEALRAVDDVGDLANTWEIRRLADVCVSIVDGSHNPPPRSSSGLPYITAKNVIGGRVELDGCTFISDEDAPAVTKRYVPRDGDVLLTCVGTIGRIAIVHGSERFAIDRNVAALRPHAVGIDPKYLEIVLRGPEMQRIISAASGSTAQPHIYLKEIRSLVCPLPPLAEQKRIVTKVDQLMTLCDDLEAKLQQAQTDADNLLTAIVHELVGKQGKGGDS